MSFSSDVATTELDLLRRLYDELSEKKAKDRINASLRWLAHDDHPFITIRRRPGQPPTVTLNEETLRSGAEGESRGLRS